MKSFSVVVCTHNGADRLPSVLSQLGVLAYPKELTELIIVDNGSTDDTDAVTRRVWNELGDPFAMTIVREDKPGLAHARKTGTLLAQYEYLVFCDDDNLLSADYLHVASSVLETHGNIGVLGGQGVPQLGAAAPNWFYTFADGYAVGVQAAASGDITQRGFVWGAGAIMRRDFLAASYRAGLRHLLSGRRGDRLLSGDDSEICKWFMAAQYLLWYEEKLVFQHVIPAHRLTRAYLDSLLQGFREQSVVLKEYDLLLTLKSLRRRRRDDLLRWVSFEIAKLVNRTDVRFQVQRNLKAIEHGFLDEPSPAG